MSFAIRLSGYWKPFGGILKIYNLEQSDWKKSQEVQQTIA